MTLFTLRRKFSVATAIANPFHLVRNQLGRPKMLERLYWCLFCGLLAVPPVVLGADAPTARAGADQTVLEGSTVTLDGTGSSDPNPGQLDPTSQSGHLPGGTALQVKIDGIALDGTLRGSATLGEGPSIAQTAIAYVIDLSGSANFPGGCGGDQNNDNLTNRIIDCQIAAALELHKKVIAAGTVAEVGLVTFSSSAKAVDLDHTLAGKRYLVAPTADADGKGVNDFEQALRTLRAGGGTNFYAAVDAACDLLAGSVASNRLAVFLSDGEATIGAPAVSILPCDPAVRFEGFAIGDNSRCDLGRAGTRMQDITAATGGTCTNVTQTGNLRDILPKLINTQLTRATLSIDGKAPIDISQAFSPSLPALGPVSLSFGATLPPLGDGLHNVCVTVYASDAGGAGLVTTCAQTRIGNAPLQYQWTLLDADGPPIFLSSTSDPRPSFLTADDGTYLFELTVANGFGLSSHDRVQVTVTNRQPTMRAAPGEAFAGGVTLINASFTDEGYIDTHRAHVSWGDGVIDEVPIAVQGPGWGSFFGSHIYQAEGIYQVVLTVTDDDGSVASQTLDRFAVTTPLALWANSTTMAKSLDWSGSSGEIRGRVHSNNELRFVGQTKTVVGPSTYSRLLSTDTDKHIFSQSPALAPIQAYPARYELADYRPGGAASLAVGAAYFDMSSRCVNGRWHETQAILAPGIYYASCDILVNGANIGGRVTVVSEKTIQVAGSRPAFEPYFGGLLFLAGANSDNAIAISASSSKFLGALFADLGEITITGSDNRFFCGILGDRIDLSGSNLRLRGADCRSATASTAGPLLVPKLGLTLNVSRDQVLPGSAFDFELKASNDGATLIVPGLLGLENVDTTAATVKSYAYVFEFFSVADGRWVPFASAAAAVDGYTPVAPLPTLGGISLTVRSNAAPGVTFGAGIDSILDTTINADAFATWGAQAAVTLSAEQVTRLLDPAQTAGIRNRVTFELSPSSIQLRRLFTIGDNFIDTLRSLSGDITDAELTLLQPTGDAKFLARTPELGRMVPGAATTLVHTYQVPLLETRGIGETDASYLARLAALDGSPLYGAAFARATGGVGMLIAPMELAFATEVAPLLSLATTGPAQAFPGNRLSYQIATNNMGAAPASGVVFTNTFAGAPKLPTPGVPSRLEVGQVINSALAVNLPPDQPAGTVFNSSSITWLDVDGNAYGPVAAEVKTTVGVPPAIRATLRDSLALDTDANGLVSPGDTILYELVIANAGDRTVIGVKLELAISTATQLKANSITTTAGTIVDGNAAGDTRVVVEAANLPARSNITIAFSATISAAVSSVSVQGQVTSAELAPVLTDDPDVSGSANPTVTRIAIPTPALLGSLSAELVHDGDGSGATSAGDVLRYRLEFANAGTAPATHARVEVPVPAGTTLVANAANANVGSLLSGLAATDRYVTLVIPTFAADQIGTLNFDTAIDNPLPTGVYALTTQGSLSADALAATPSDDPSTLAENDPTTVSLQRSSGGTGGSGGIGGTDTGEHSMTGTNGLPAPVTSGLSIADGSVIASAVTVTASLNPPAGESVVRWTVYYRPLGSTELTELASGTGTQVSAELDPTLLANGLYGIVIEAESSNGGISRTESYVTVEGELKPGRYSLAIEDLTVNVGTLPISVQRHYDSFDRRRGDFGHGWQLKTSNFVIQTNGLLGAVGWRQEVVPGSVLIAMLDFKTDKPHFITVTWPDGTVEVFDLVPTRTTSWFSFLSSAEFKARPGSTSKLEAVDASLYFSNEGNLYSGIGSGLIYNPQRFRLIDKSGTEYLIDKKQGLLQSRDTNGNTLTINNNGIVHSQGLNVAFQRDAQNRITEIVDPAGNPIKYEYDAAGDLIAVTDQASQRTTFSYLQNPAHYLLAIIDPLGRLAQRTEYDVDGRVVAIIDALGNRVSQDYNPSTLTLSEMDRRGYVTELVYDERGNLVEERDPKGGVTRYGYGDPRHPAKATSITDANGHAKRYTFDAGGNVLTLAQANGAVSRYTYDGQGRTVAATDALGHVERYEYDGAANLTRYTNKAGDTKAMTYDALGRLMEVADAAGSTIRYGYGTSSLPSEAINPDGSRRRFAYNASGQVVRLTDENGFDAFMEYDSMGRVNAMRDHQSNRVAYVYTGNAIAQITDAAGSIVRFEYNAEEQLIREIDENGGVSVFGYDAEGNRTSLTDPSGNVTRLVYDGNGRVIEEVNPLGRSRYFAYDPVGNLTRATDRNGRVTEHIYDEMNNHVQERWFDAGGALAQTLTFNFDVTGQMTAVRGPGSNYDFRYDAKGRITQISNLSAPSGTFTLNYAYDASDNVLKVTDSRGVEVSSTYDARGLLASRGWQGGLVAPARIDLGYDGVGQVASVERYTNLAGSQSAGRSSVQYDYARRISRVAHQNAANAPLAQYSYTYDPMNLVDSEVRNGTTIDYAHDRTFQLLRTDQPGAANDESYVYDASGNRIGSGQRIGLGHRLLSDAHFAYGYDNEGNLIHKRSLAGGDVEELAYDHRNRLARVERRTAAGAVLSVVEHRYDAFDRRLSRAVDSDGTGPLASDVSYFVHDGFNSWADLDESGAETARYLASDAIDKTLARYRADDGLAFYLADAQGTVRDIVNASGTVINHVEYDSFGNVLTETGPLAGDRFKFTGREYDPELDLYYYRARYYDPGSGRFASVDPLGFNGGDYNLYRYVFNSPANYLDPLGQTVMTGYTLIGREIFRQATMQAMDCVGLNLDAGIRKLTFYVLLATDMKTGKEGFYIGRSEHFDDRLSDHEAKRTGKTGVTVVKKISIPMPKKFDNDLVGGRNWMRWVEQRFMNAYKGYSTINRRKEIRSEKEFQGYESQWCG